jgi:hypothetical protein
MHDEQFGRCMEFTRRLNGKREGLATVVCPS